MVFLYQLKIDKNFIKKKLKLPFDLKLKQYYIKYRNLLNLLIKKLVVYIIVI
jgi:hypothetical protein